MIEPESRNETFMLEVPIYSQRRPNIAQVFTHCRQTVENARTTIRFL